MIVVYIISFDIFDNSRNKYWSHCSKAGNQNSINFYSSSQLLYKSGGTIGLFALFPIMLMSIDFTLIIFSGYLMLTSDIPVSREDNLFIIIRSDRLTWFVSQFLYGFFLALTHLLLVFFY